MCTVNQRNSRHRQCREYPILHYRSAHFSLKNYLLYRFAPRSHKKHMRIIGQGHHGPKMHIAKLVLHDPRARHPGPLLRSRISMRNDLHPATNQIVMIVKLPWILIKLLCYVDPGIALALAVVTAYVRLSLQGSSSHKLACTCTPCCCKTDTDGGRTVS